MCRLGSAAVWTTSSGQSPEETGRPPNPPVGYRLRIHRQEPGSARSETRDYLVDVKRPVGWDPGIGLEALRGDAASLKSFRSVQSRILIDIGLMPNAVARTRNAVLHDISGLGLLVGRRLRRPRPGRPAGPGRPCARRVRYPGDRRGQVGVRHGCPAIPVLRGASARPVFVTAAGMPRADAAALVRLRAGRFRVPDALRRADQLARTGPRAPTHRSHHPG
jgi:hypothetical protein